MTRLIHETREAWLIAAMKLLGERFFEDKGYTVPPGLSVSCGFPLGKRSAIGQCWDPEVTKDGTTHMFICPSIGLAVSEEPYQAAVLDILLHEMIHAVVGLEEKHGGMFKKLALEFGLEGKMTATYVTPGTPLHAVLEVISEKLGTYPHSRLDKSARKKVREKKGGYLKFNSVDNPEFKIFISPKVYEELGAPFDPWGNEMVELPPEVRK